jgi:hypothetical protein
MLFPADLRRAFGKASDNDSLTICNDAYREAFAEALWLALMCQCESCGKVLSLDSIDHLMDVDTMKWSEAAAVEAMRGGWRYERSKIACNACIEGA